MKKVKFTLAFTKGVCYNNRASENRGIVQSVEHQSPKLGVVGSSPSAPAKKKADCESNLLFSVKSVLADGINPTNVG